MHVTGPSHVSTWSRVECTLGMASKAPPQISPEQISKAREALDVLSALSSASTGSEPGPSSASKNADSTEGEVLYMQAEFASYIYVNIFFLY